MTKNIKAKQTITLFPISEVWVKIKGFEKYEISNFGRVRKGERILKGYESNHGYLQISIYDESGKLKNILIHRLVALHFIPCKIGDPKKLQVNHKDKDRHNNKVKNLEWMTRSDNMKHRYEYEKKIIPLIGDTSKLEVCRLLKKYKKHDNRISIIAALLGITYDQVFEVQKESNQAIITNDEKLLQCC